MLSLSHEFNFCLHTPEIFQESTDFTVVPSVYPLQLQDSCPVLGTQVIKQNIHTEGMIQCKLVMVTSESVETNSYADPTG